MRDFQLDIERSLKLPAFEFLCLVGILLYSGNFRTSHSHTLSPRPPPTLTCSSSAMGAAPRGAGLSWVRLRALRPIQSARNGSPNEILLSGWPCKARRGILRLRGAGYSSDSNKVDQEGKGDSAEDVDVDRHVEEDGEVEGVVKRGKDDAIRAGGLGTAKDLGLDELSSWEETTTDEDVKKGLIRRDPHGFHGACPASPDPTLTPAHIHFSPFGPGARILHLWSGDLSLPMHLRIRLWPRIGRAWSTHHASNRCPA